MNPIQYFLLNRPVDEIVASEAGQVLTSPLGVGVGTSHTISLQAKSTGESVGDPVEFIINVNAVNAQLSTRRVVRVAELTEDDEDYDPNYVKFAAYMSDGTRQIVRILFSGAVTQVEAE